MGSIPSLPHSNEEPLYLAKIYPWQRCEEKTFLIKNAALWNIPRGGVHFWISAWYGQQHVAATLPYEEIAVLQTFSVNLSIPTGIGRT